MSRVFKRALRLLSAFVAAALLAGCAAFTPLPPPTTLSDRLKALPLHGLPLSDRVVIHWDPHQIPFIEAASDDDLAFALGLVHAHLRLGQMEIMRRISQGRVAEMGGPFVTDIDHSLRILNLGRAAPAIVDAMPAHERRWLDRFVDGINHYQRSVAHLPHEFALLGLEREPWTATDVVTIGRLASTDINWLVWFRLLPYREQPGWPALWARLVNEGTTSVPSFIAPPPERLAGLETILRDTGRSGSNSMAIAGSRTASGAALMASDPHLGLRLPNLWLIAGYKSPSYHAVGLMVPGLPFVAVGRNPWIAWGGTNMRAANTDLFDVRGLPASAIRERRERVKVRWWFDTEVPVRETDYGPLISDAPALGLGADHRIALRWIGHRPTDELTAMLRVNRARDWNAFRQALAGFAISPQNFLYADVDGNIGMVAATQLPRRATDKPGDIVQPVDAAAAWDRIIASPDLPASYNPPSGVLASANNKPVDAPVPISFFYSASDRIGRMNSLFAGTATVGLDTLRAAQQDVYMASAVAFRDRLKAPLEAALADGTLDARAAAVARALLAWDGHYRRDAIGPLAFEVTIYHLARGLIEPTTLDAYGAIGRSFALIADDIAALPAERVAEGLRQALAAAAPVVDRHGTWGEFHRLDIAHALAALPLIGGRYRLADLPTAGSSETLHKSAHGLHDERHFTRYGANARHLSDLADPDANYFVLLGGQDGWFRSTTFIDQIDLWQKGAYVQVPLVPETARSRAAQRTELTPAR